MNSEDFSNLKILPHAVFPKHCRCCGKVYLTPEDFLQQTKPLQNQQSGLKEDETEDGQLIVDVFRNCVCGSTLMDEFKSRRDTSPEGLRRRAQYHKP